jgi:ribonuclease BN (tRNA processing enzyme)
VKFWGVRGSIPTPGPKTVRFGGNVSVLTGQMESTYFPVPFDKLPSNIEIEELKKYDFKIGSVRVRAQRAHHPGTCVGYRLFTPRGSVAYFPDSEPRPGGEDREMIQFLNGSDVLILDSQYDALEYKRHAGWGHGCVDDSVAVALAAKVKRLCLFHHDPERSDQQVDAFLKHARQLVSAQRAKLKVDAAREGMVIRLGGKG